MCPGTGPAGPSVPPVAAGLVDWLLQRPEPADWLGRLRERRELHGPHWTAAQQQPEAVPEPAAATTAAAPAVKLSANQRGGKEERRQKVR